MANLTEQRRSGLTMLVVGQMDLALAVAALGAGQGAAATTPDRGSTLAAKGLIASAPALPPVLHRPMAYLLRENRFEQLPTLFEAWKQATDEANRSRVESVLSDQPNLRACLDT